MKRIATLLLAAAALGASLALAAEPFATVDQVHGSAYAVDAAGRATPLLPGSKVYEGQTLTTRADSELHLVTTDNAFLALRPNTSLRVDAYRGADSDTDRIDLALVSGALRSITGWIAKLRRDSYRLRTPTATIGIRGTDHETVELDNPTGKHEAGVYERVYEGATAIIGEDGEFEVRAGNVGFRPRDRRAAAHLLHDMPEFLREDRPLRIEHHIAKRKEALAEAIKRIPDRRAERDDSDAADGAAGDRRPRVHHRMIKKFRHRND